MRNSTSILSLLLAVGIYGAGPIVTKFSPFSATAAYAVSPKVVKVAAKVAMMAATTVVMTRNRATTVN